MAHDKERQHDDGLYRTEAPEGYADATAYSDDLTGYEQAAVDALRESYLEVRPTLYPSLEQWARSIADRIPRAQVFDSPALLGGFLIAQHRVRAIAMPFPHQWAALLILAEIAETIWADAAANGKSFSLPRAGRHVA